MRVVTFRLSKNVPIKDSNTGHLDLTAIALSTVLSLQYPGQQIHSVNHLATI